MTTRKILVADDSLTIQKVIRLALSNEGYEIHAVSDGKEAIEQIALFRPDVVLIDISLPIKTAIEVKQDVGTDPDLKKTKFVLMSSAFEQVDETSIASAHFDGRLIKPFDPAHLRQVLSDVLKRPTSMSQEVNLSDDLWSSPPPPPPAFSKDEDIKQLTEDTLKMSGFEDQGWNINESHIETIGDRTLSFIQSQEPELPPHPQMVELDDSGFKFDPPPPPTVRLDENENEAPSKNNNGVVALNQNDLEKLVHTQLEETLRKMIKTTLPDIAEKVIKEEIKKLLSQPPHL